MPRSNLISLSASEMLSRSYEKISAAEDFYSGWSDQKSSISRALHLHSLPTLVTIAISAHQRVISVPFLHLAEFRSVK